MFDWLIDWRWNRNAQSKKTGPALEKLFTIRKGIRYRATVTLDFIESYATNAKMRIVLPHMASRPRKLRATAASARLKARGISLTQLAMSMIT